MLVDLEDSVPSSTVLRVRREASGFSKGRQTLKPRAATARHLLAPDQGRPVLLSACWIPILSWMNFLSLSADHMPGILRRMVNWLAWLVPRAVHVPHPLWPWSQKTAELTSMVEALPLADNCIFPLM